MLDNYTARRYKCNDFLWTDNTHYRAWRRDTHFSAKFTVSQKGKGHSAPFQCSDTPFSGKKPVSPQVIL